MNPLPCEASRPSSDVETLRQTNEDGSVSTYRKVYLCNKSGKVYNREDPVVLCDEHSYLAP